MKHKITALCVAIITAFTMVLGSVSAFAATEESSTGSEFLDSYFSDWEEAGEQAKILRDTYKQFLYNVCTGKSLEKILGDAKEIPIAWLRTTKAGVFAITPADNIFYWLVNGNLVFDDRTSGQSVKTPVNQDVQDPTVYLPKPWTEIIKDAPAPDGPSTGGTDMSGIIGNVSTGVKGVFGIAKGGFDFILKNALCMFMVSISFAGVALGFVARSFRTSRK